METGNITDDQLEASSDLSNGTGLLHWRLNQDAVPDIPGAWVALYTDVKPWVQISLHRRTQVTGLIVQGRVDAAQWVTTYKVKTSLDRRTWTYVENEEGAAEVSKVGF